MDCVECMYFDAISGYCSLRGNCVYESEPDCENCWFYANGQCQRVGGCRYDD